MESLERSSTGSEKFSGNILDTDSSITILDIPCSISNTIQPKTSSEVALQSSFPESIDPAFADYYFVFPQTLESFVGRIKDKRFVYRFSENKALEIVRCKDHETVYALDVFDLEKDDIGACNNSISLVVNRSKYRSSVKAKEDREYRKALSEGRRYIRGRSPYESKIEAIHLEQITNSRNFVFADDPQDLPGELKAIIKHLHSKRVHVPKTKAFSVEQKTDHLQNVLQNIPGIGKDAARSLSLHFKSISRLYSFLKGENNGQLSELKVWDSDGKHSRPLGEKQSDKIRNAFIGKSGSL
ncbi:putative vesicular transport protein [Encephalitozoon romaleae SJ-2008]|uniref:Vesicular transport protein n=1 Tax=Encephalitozoon romaleae (strain SJ-2008) TaxID=1178016 RepID=I6ZJ80_ENCRO|nr:putative vesicular transport protein [Encephalitozoon romaleae SJ-2008]AFN83288.1 putative vesicular transport protein [Encephalitozoon romaleae SJ-2008]